MGETVSGDWCLLADSHWPDSCLWFVFESPTRNLLKGKTKRREEVLGVGCGGVSSALATIYRRGRHLAVHADRKMQTLRISCRIPGDPNRLHAMLGKCNLQGLASERGDRN